jgi:hypothetical protein
VTRDAAIDLLDRLHRAQNAFYAGGPETAFELLFAPKITWSVPGENRIAGTYRGRARCSTTSDDDGTSPIGCSS